jgi:formylglycine-generating enzyme required for sulfatase activity
VYDYYWGGDLAGNQDGGYSDLTDVDPARISPRVVGFRVVRGGSWLEPLLFARVYSRSHDSPESRSFSRGFRCVRDIEP